MLDGVAPATLAALSRCPAQAIPAGGALFHAGDRVASVLRLTEGRAAVTRTLRAGDVVTLAHLGSGDAPGLASCVRGVAIPVNVVALTPVEVDVYPATLLKQLFVADPTLAANAMYILGGYVLRLGEKLEDRIGDVPERLGRTILRLAAEHGSWSSDDVVAIDVARHELADLVGSTTPTISRVLSSWARRGLIRSARRRVTVLNVDRLVALADPEA